jgi:hypothetical protein
VMERGDLTVVGGVAGADGAPGRAG